MMKKFSNSINTSRLCCSLTLTCISFAWRFVLIPVPHSVLAAGTNWGMTSFPFFLFVVLSPIKRFGSWDEPADTGEGVEAEEEELEEGEEWSVESEGGGFEELVLCSRRSRRCLRVVASSRASVESVARRALVWPEEENGSSWWLLQNPEGRRPEKLAARVLGGRNNFV